MNIKKRILRFVLPFLASFLILFQSLVPAAVVFAEVASPVPDGTGASPEPQPESSQPLAEEIQPLPSPASPDASLGGSGPSTSPEPSNLENSQSEELSLEVVSSANINETILDFGQIESASSATLATVKSVTHQVNQGETYSLADTLVSIKFTKVSVPGTVTISEVNLSSEQVSQLNAASDTAYEITSTMPDETFEYDLTLPVPPQADNNLEVKVAESEEKLTNAQTVTEETLQTTETVTVRGLTHFTVFVLVNDVDGDDSGDATDDIANGVFSPIDDTWADQDEPNDDHDTGELHVRSKEDENKRTFIGFDVSSVPEGSDVTKATLRLFMFDAPSVSRTYGAYRVTEGWDEDVLTWNNQPDAAAEATSTFSTGITNTVWREFDVTGDIQSFIDGDITNYGWMVRDTSEDSSMAQLGKFRSSSQSNELRRPQLVVDFAAAEDQPTDYKSPTTEEATSGGDGDGFETSPSNAFSDGGGVASNTDDAGARHLFYNYNPFDIPEDSTINGIEVRTDWNLDSKGGTNSLDVELSWNGGEDWTDPKTDITETDKEHVASLGGATDTWGREWSAEEFSNENFRVRVTMNSSASGRDFFLDWIPVRVYYTEAEEEDTTEPTDPADVHSTSHGVNVDSQDSTIDMAWTEAGSAPGATDDNSGVDGYSFAFTSGAGDVPDTTKDIEENITGVTSESQADGTWYFHLRTVDNAANWTATVHEGPFIIDTTAPQSTLESPEDSSFWGVNGVYIAGSSTDIPATTVDYVILWAYSYSDDEWFEITTIDNENENEPFNWSYTWFPDFEDYYDIVAEATDKAGNTDYSENAYAEEIVYDISAPTSTLTSPTENTFWNTPIEIRGETLDEFSVDFVRLFWRTSGVEEEQSEWTEIDTNPDEEGVQPLFNEDGDGFDWSFDWTPSTEGTFDIKAEAIDKAGNVENSPVVEYVTYDVTGPVVSTPSASPDPTNHPPQILADAIDALSNIVSAVFSVDDPDFIFAKPLEALDGFFDSLAETLFGPEFDNGMDYPGEGLHTLYVGAYDAAGNFGSNSGPFSVDTTAPTVTSAETQDTDDNGKIDAIKLTFSENIDDSLLNIGDADGWDVVDYEGEGIGTGENDNDNVLFLTFNEGESYDTGATPVVIYSPSGGGDIIRSTHDTAGNELESYEESADDKALPVLLSAFTRDTDTNGQIDALELTFSEDIDDDMLDDSEFANGDGWDVDSYEDEVIGTGETDDDNVLLLTFSESGNPDTGTTPDVFYSSSEDEDTSTHDLAGNELASNEWGSDDGAAPISSITFPEEDVSYTEDEWGGEIQGTAEDNFSTGINSVLVSVQRDTDNAYWDADDEEWVTGEQEEEEYLNEAEFDGEEGTWSFDFEFIEPEGEDEGYTVRSHAVDNAENQEDTTEVHFFFSHGLPIISNESTVNVGSAQVTFVWDTDMSATSRVIYDTVSHPDPLGEAPNYGYANSTGESDTNPKVTAHTLIVCCFNESTTYYYRTVSQGSPEAVSAQQSFTTMATPPQSINPNSQQSTSTSTSTIPTTADTSAGAVTQLGQIFGIGTAEEVLSEATAEATPTASPSPSPVLGVQEEKAREAKAFWQNWWFLILLALLGAGAFWWYAKKPKE